jgi:multicomponent Na+:H+ antiporter subunit G
MGLFDGVAAAFIVAGALFFFAGTAGLLRFPDTLSRLHALTKADNLGLGLIVLGLGLSAGSFLVALKLVLIWLVALMAGSTVCHLVGDLLRRTSPQQREP